MTPTELLGIREKWWRQNLAAVSLAAEALDDVSREHREQAVRVLGDMVKSRYGASERARVLRRWPAVQVLATAGVAADYYEHAAFWPKLCDLLDASNDQQFHREWGDAFLANLRRLEMPTFDRGDEDAGSRYVGRILMHSGMPTHCLRDFFTLVGERRSRSGGDGPDQMVAWAAARAAAKQLNQVARPVARFLQFGGEFAVDVVARSYDLLDAIAAGGDGSDVPLPERFRVVARAITSEGALARPSRLARAVLNGREFQPRLAVDPFGRGLVLRLPAVGNMPDGSAVWLVSLDGIVERVPTRAAIPGVIEIAPPTDVAVLRPARIITACLAGREHLQTSIPVIDDRSPLLAFDEDGSILTANAPLPAREVWLLFPGEASALDVTGDARVVATSPLPASWSDWSLILVDLASVTAVSVAGTGAARDVRRVAAATVEAPGLVGGVRTTGGAAVHSQLPTVKLPAELAEAAWEITLLDAGGEACGTSIVENGSGDPARIWEDVPRPLIGTFTVRVRGPWGRGTHRTVTVVEGLEVAWAPAWRRFEGNGLVPGSARLRVAPGVDLTKGSVAFSPFDREAYVRAGGPGGALTLMLTAPHMAVSYQVAGASPGESIRPIQIGYESLVSEPGTLVLNLGSAGEPTLFLRAATGAVLQTIPAGAGRGGVYRFDLAKTADTVRNHPAAEIALDAGGEIVVARIRPERLFSAIDIAGDELVFSDCADIPDLTVYVYATTAPWREPAALPVTGGRAMLPAWLREAGTLSVHVRLDDPWVPAPVPDWPGRGEAVLVPASGWLRSDDAAETALSAFVAGERNDLPGEVGELGRLWTVRALVYALGLRDRMHQVAAGIDQALEARPREALVAVATSRLSLATIPSLMVRAGLPWADLSALHEDTPPAWDMRSALSATLLSAADGKWSSDEISEAATVLGDQLTALLGGADPDPSAGKLGASTDLFDREPSIRPAMLRHLRLIPKALLDRDSRTMASIEFVEHRRDESIVLAAKKSQRAMDDLERLFRMIGDDVAWTAICERRHPEAVNGWRLLPAVSLGLAFAARNAARGNNVARDWLQTQRVLWARLAEGAPSLVTTDLIIAELLTAARLGQGIGERSDFENRQEDS